MLHIAYIYLKIQLKTIRNKIIHREINKTIEAIKKPTGKENIHFTLIEKIAGTTIFHGTSKHTVTERDFATIAKIVTKTRPGLSATVSHENNDPHLFKIVVW